MYKDPLKQKITLEAVCDVCGRPISSGKERSDVTRYLLEESRCRCVNTSRDSKHSSDSQQNEPGTVPTAHVAISNQASNANPPAQWKQKFASLLENMPENYKALSLLGVGGMGAVFKCLDTNLHRVCAVKMLRPQFVNNETAIARFKHEAQSAKRLSHHGTAEIFDFGIGEKGAPYLVMELIDGETLSAILSSGKPLQVGHALRIFIQIAKILDYAHSINLVHRDVKPSNIIIERLQNGEERVHLLDFGIAKTLFLEGAVAQGLTQTGEIFGSPPYMSPEQCEGKPQDAQSDIYAFGCVMFECLCGHPPFVSVNPIRVILDHLEKTAPAVTECTTQFIPEDLSKIIQSCLRKDPNLRFFRMAQIEHELEACLQWLPVSQVETEPQQSPDSKIVPLNGETILQFNAKDDDNVTNLIQERLRRSEMILGKKHGAAQDKTLIDEFPLNLDLEFKETKTKSRRNNYIATTILVLVSAAIVGVFGVAAITHHQQNADPTYAANSVILRLARSYIDDGRYELAEPLLESVKSTYATIPSPDGRSSGEVASLFNDLATHYENQYKFARALSCVQEARNLTPGWELKRVLLNWKYEDLTRREKQSRIGS